MGIIYGLYFKKSIVFILPIIFIIYIVINFINKNNFIRYLKLCLNFNIFITIIVSAVISNTYILYSNYKYNKFYKNVPETINTKAVVVR